MCRVGGPYTAIDFGPGGPLTAQACAVDGPGGPISRGDRPQRDSTKLCLPPAYRNSKRVIVSYSVFVGLDYCVDSCP